MIKRSRPGKALLIVSSAIALVMLAFSATWFFVSRLN